MSYSEKEPKEALLVSAGIEPHQTIEDNLQELVDLAESAGLTVAGQLKQRLKKRDPAFLIGKGKRRELEEFILKNKSCCVIFDHNLSGAQTRNWEKLLKVPVWDRSQLILKIFAQRAKSHEGKLQVRLAWLTDQMSRMTGAWLGSLSRQGGGGSAKGPGEKALETDRRQIQTQIKRLKLQLEKVRQRRGRRRKRRKKRQIPSFALIGWTNSGKSSLLNRLTRFNAETKDLVFMTLDPKSRQIFIPDMGQAVLTDTVGFIRHLPPVLLSAFKATLEEVRESDALLHVIDASHPQSEKHIQTIHELIEEFGWANKPIIHIFNKADLIPDGEKTAPSAEGQNQLIDEGQALKPLAGPQLYVSAKTGQGLKALLSQMKITLENLKLSMELFFPKAKGYHKSFRKHEEAPVEP